MLHNEYKRKALAAQGTAYRMVLLKETFVQNIDTQMNYADISAVEVSAPGYTAGGKLMTGVTIVKNDGTDVSVLSADATTWSNIDLSGSPAAFVAIVVDTGVATTDTIALSDTLKDAATGTAKVFNGNYATLTVPVPSGGIAVIS